MIISLWKLFLCRCTMCVCIIPRKDWLNIIKAADDPASSRLTGFDGPQTTEKRTIFRLILSCYIWKFSFEKMFMWNSQLFTILPDTESLEASNAFPHLGMFLCSQRLKMHFTLLQPLCLTHFIPAYAAVYIQLVCHFHAYKVDGISQWGLYCISSLRILN